VSYTMKTAISIPEDLYQAVKEYAGERKFSTVICELVKRALYGETPDSSVDLQPVIDRIESLEKNQDTGLVKMLLMEVESLKNRMSVLEERYDEEEIPEDIPDAVVYPEINTLVETSPVVTPFTSDVSQVQVITESVPDIPEPVQEEDGELTQDNVTPGRLWQPSSVEVSGDEEELPPERVTPKRRKELFMDRISLTPDIKAGILKRFEEMKAAGLSKVNIAGIMGYKRSTSISEIESGKCSTIPRQGYEALMAWSP